MTTYRQAADYLRERKRRDLPGRSTYIISHWDADGAHEHISIYYHDTPVVTFYDDGRVMLCDGGYQTVTTKARMNLYSPARIFQDRGVWYVNDKACRYFSGIVVDSAGRPLAKQFGQA